MRLGRHRQCGGAVGLRLDRRIGHEYAICSSCRERVPEADIEPDPTHGGPKPRLQARCGRGWTPTSYTGGRGAAFHAKNKLR